MKKRFLVFGVIFAFVLIVNIGCGSSVEDQPQMPNVGSETTDSVDADPFIPYTGPIQPLTEYLRPVLTEGKRWKTLTVYDHEFSNPDDFNTWCAVGGDTIVDGRDASIIYFNDEFDLPSVELMRESDGRVDFAYAYKGQKATWLNLFNVNAQLKDSIVGTCKVIPLSKGVITLMGYQRRAVKAWCVRDIKLNWSVDAEYPFDYWVEGIGMLFGHLPETSWAVHSPFYYPLYRKLLECWDGDTKIYDHREFKESLYQPIEVYAEPSDFPEYSRWKK